MRILVTGKYEPEYNRNLVLLSGLRESSVELIELPYPERRRKVRKKIRKLAQKADLIFLPSFTHLDVPFVKSATEKPLIFDPLISRYLSKVFDYKAVSRYSPRAYKNFLKDKVSFRLADLIVADTQSHKEYYISKFGLDPAKLFVMPVGVRTDDFYPVKESIGLREDFRVGFYGSFIPLHGIDNIMKAAKILKDQENISFRIYGEGRGFREIFNAHQRDKLHNLSLEGWAKYEDLNSIINSFDLCLGIFGDSLKADLVIPNKIYHYSACHKPSLTKDTQAIREIFTGDKDIILTSGDPEDLAAKILEASKNKQEIEHIGRRAGEMITENYNQSKITGIFLQHAEKLLQKGSSA